MQKIIDGKMQTICEGCGEPIPPYEGVSAGYVSPLSDEKTPERWRQVAVDGVTGWENIPKVVCKECYRIDFAKKYPDQECQI